MDSVELAEYVNELLDHIDALIVLEDYVSAICEIFAAAEDIRTMYSAHSMSSEAYFVLMKSLTQKYHFALSAL